MNKDIEVNHRRRIHTTDDEIQIYTDCGMIYRYRAGTGYLEAHHPEELGKGDLVELLQFSDEEDPPTLSAPAFFQIIRDFENLGS